MDQVSVEYGNFTVQSFPTFPTPTANETVRGESYSSEHIKNGPYNQYLIDSKYSTDTGLRVIPKAASGESPTVNNSVVRVHRGVTTKAVVWTVERCNKLPKLPDLDTKDPNEIAERQEITFANKLQLLNGNTIYRVSGVNYYSLIKPKNNQSKYPIGTTPAEVSPSSANFYGPNDFDKTIIDAAFAAPGGILEIPIRVGS